MKIAFLGLRSFPHTFSGVSGVEKRGEEIIRYLAKKDEIYVFVRKWLYNDRVKLKHIKIIPILSPQFKYFDTFIYSFISSIRASFLPVDLIFIEGTASGLFCFIPKLFGKKIILTVHSKEWERKKWNILGKVVLRIAEKTAVSIADRIIVVSERLNEHISSSFNRKSILIPYYFSYKKPISSDLISTKYKLEKNSYILFLGRFTPEKRIEWLIQEYLKLHTKVKLVLAGGRTHDRGYYELITRMVQNHEEIIMTDYVFGKEKEELLSNCLFFVLPSETEGYSLALSEALSYKKRVLVGDANAIFSSNVFAFQNANRDDFSKQLKSLLSKPHLLSERGESKQMTMDDFFLQYRKLLLRFK